jgi:hypothetical protein
MAILPVGIGSAEGGDFQIERSLRFNSADSTSLNRTPGSASNRKTWTWSGWVKRGTLGASSGLFQASPVASNQTSFAIAASNTIFLQDYSAASSYNLVWESSAVFRDPSAWYHIIFVFDTTQASSANAVKLYVNGVQQTLVFTAYTGAYVQNRDGYINSNIAHNIGLYSTSDYFNGYLTEINFIDGSALDPTSFGEYNEDTGVWQPKAYTGSYGTNGFYLNFSDNASTTTLGDDLSGNGNDWTLNNFATSDSLPDTPSNNHATFNVLEAESLIAFSEGNLKISYSGSAARVVARSTSKAPSNTDVYFEMVMNTSLGGGVDFGIGIENGAAKSANDNAVFDNGYFYREDGTFRDQGGSASYGATYTNADVIGVWRKANGDLVFYKNGASQGTAKSGLTGEFFLCGAPFNGAAATARFAFSEWTNAPTGVDGTMALCTQNLPEPTIVDGGEYFNTVLYTGDGAASRTITGVGFQPDFVWAKSRSTVINHFLQDSVRGANKVLASSTANPEYNSTTDFSDGGLGTSASDGFTIVSGTANANNLNQNAATYVAWNWKANGSGVSNTDGTITSTVSANTTSGISICTYTGTGSAATVGHGLDSAPEMMIIKNRDTTNNWFVYTSSLGATKYLLLNTTAAEDTSGTTFNNVAPTSSVFSVGTWVGTNGSTNDMIAYCFAAIPSFSAMGSYLGNGSADGPFVYTGFRPAFVMIKRSSAVNNWVIQDTSRSVYNVSQNNIYADSSGAEASYVSELTDILSNGFKQRETGISMNGSGSTYIYMAFAENPFKYALAR